MDNNYRHIVLTFDQAQQPKFEEKKGKGWVEYGQDGKPIPLDTSPVKANEPISIE